MKDASWFSRNTVEKLANLRATSADTPQKDGANLTKREQEVLERMCQGADDQAIGEALTLSRTTVRNHVARIYGKIDVKKRGAAIVWGRERGFARATTKHASFGKRR